MSSLTVAPEAGETELLGKRVDTLQSNIVVGDDAITGTLLYVSDFTQFSSKPEEQKGNYLALKFTNGTPGAETYVEVVNGTKGPVKLDEDMQHISLIRNKDTQKIKVIVIKGKDKAEKIYSLKGLTLQSAG